MPVREMIVISMFAALTAIFAQLAIPLPISPVPVTLQVLAVCLAAAILGSRLGTLSQLLYVGIGMLGMPVFAGGTSGLHAVIGPRGGYIIGFVAAAYVIGRMVERRSVPTYANSLAAMLTGLVIIYSAGMVQLSMVTGMPLAAAFMAGVLPFIGADAIKIALGSYVACSVRWILIRQKLLW